MSRIWVLTFLSLMLLSPRTEAGALTLRECLQKAASANHELKVAAYDAKIAEENIRVARSGFLPRLNFQGGYTAQHDPQAVLIQGYPIPTQQSDYGFFSTSLEQTIYDFGRTASRYEQAKALTDATAYSYSAREKDVFLQVVEAYYGILENKKLLHSADEEVLQMEDHVNIARNLFEQGVVTRNDLLQAEVQLANSRQRRIAAANRVENSWLFLNYLTGQPSGFRSDQEDGGNLEPIPPRTDATGIMANRSEIKAAKKTLQAGELAVRESRSGFYPELFARVGADYVENSKVQEQTIMYATVGLRINLFDGFATTGRYRQSVKELSQSEEGLRQLEAMTIALSGAR